MPVTHQKLDRFSIWIVGSIAFLALIGGIFQIRYHLGTVQRTLVVPYQEQLASLVEERLNQFDATATPEEQDIQTLQQKDTDGDGLNDFEEYYIYVTSPYIADSDSDGIVDKAELDAGTNPNCVEGTACAEVGQNGESTTVTAQTPYSAIDPLNQYGLADAQGNVDIGQMRLQLVELGVPQSVVDQADDDTIVKEFYNFVVTQNQQAVDPGAVQQQVLEELKNASPQEKRAFLLQQGAEAAQVEALSDEEINTLFSQTIDELLESTDIDEEDQ